MRINTNWIKNLGIILLSIIVALLLGEVGLRIFGIGFGNSPLEKSRIYDHVHPKSYEFTMHDPQKEFGGFKVYYDKNRYRSPDKETKNIIDKIDANSIVFLGDSFTEGNQVMYNESFVARVGKKLSVKTLNFGVSSYSPIIYSLQTKRILKGLDCRRIVMQIYSNDFSNDDMYSKKAVFENDQLVGIDGGSNSFAIKVARKSYLARLLRKSQLTIKALLEDAPKGLSNSKLDRWEQISLIEQNVSDSKFIYTSELIMQIKRELDMQGKELAVFMIPSKALSKMGKPYDSDEVYNRFKSRMVELGINFIDVAIFFENHPKQKNLFFEKDIHLTSQGHEVIAEALSQHYKKLRLK